VSLTECGVVCWIFVINILYYTVFYYIKKGKGKIRPETGHDGSEWEQWYGCALSSTSVLDVSG
jgi:hypothetical protein